MYLNARSMALSAAVCHSRDAGVGYLFGDCCSAEVVSSQSTQTESESESESERR
jgi:hypothetical protein